jgi:transcription elongation factor Elf1
MQLNRTTRGADSCTTKSSQTLYEVIVSCNKCGGVHEMGISVALENGPVDKQSIDALYKGKTLPKNLADLANNSVSCPKTGRQSTQKNHQQIFLVPTKS